MAGARYQYIREGGGLDGSPTFAVNTTVNNAVTQEALTPRFGLLWRPEPWVSFYTTYTEGFFANTGFTYPNTPVPPTSAREAEAGVKFELFDGKLRATADYYDLTETNIPTTDLNPLHQCLGGGGGPGSCSLVTGAARSKGPEVDIQGEILPGWSVTVAYTNQDVIVTQGGTQFAQLPGQRFEGIPRNLGNFWTTYAFQDETFRGLKIGGGVLYHGSQPINASSATGTNLAPYLPLLPAYATINLMAAYSFNIGETKMTAQVNVTNLLDHTYYTEEAYDTAYGTPGLGYGSHVYGAPFSVIGSLSAQFPGSASSPFSLPPRPPVPVFTRTGPYLGGQIGYAWGDNTGNVTFVTPGGIAGVYPLIGEASGVIGGAHVGYNWQINQWVIGLEGAVEGTNLNNRVLMPFGIAGLYNTSTAGFSNIGGSVGGFVRSDVQGSVRARAGYSWDRLLIYGTAGAAFGAFSTAYNFGGEDVVPGSIMVIAPGVSTAAGQGYYATGTNAMTRVGWTAGGGVEYAVNNNWSVEAEYRYSDFGHLTDVTPGLACATSRHLAQNQVETGFSYKFDSLASDANSGATPFDFSQIRFSQVDPAVPGSSPVGTTQPGAAPAGAAHIGTAQANTTQFGSVQAVHAGPSQPGAAQGGAAPFFPAGLFSPPPLGPDTWTGFTLGFQAGFAFGDSHLNFTGFDSSVGGPAVATRTGGIGGVHIGYNYQFGDWVAGFEGSVDLTSSLSTAAFPAAFGGSVLTASTASNVQGTIRGRLGYAFDRALIYATAGVAVGDTTTSYVLLGNHTGSAINGGNPVFGANEFTNFPVGWTVGGGIDYAIDDHWSARAEYRYTSFGTISNAFVDGGALAVTPGLIGSSLNTGRQLNQHQLQAGFSYKFDSFGPLATATAASANAAPARAADLPPPLVPVITWTGPTLGGQIGYAWGDNIGSAIYATPDGLSGEDALGNIAQGVIGGAHVGYNTQIEQWVIGVEGTLDGTNLVNRPSLGVHGSAGSNAAGNTVCGCLSGIVQSNIQGAILGRAGFVFDRLLIYGTGGVAFGGFSSELGIAAGSNPDEIFYADSLKHSTTRTGWTAGGGVEYALNNNWSIRAEYRYSDFGYLKDAPVNPVAGLSYTSNRHLLQNQMQFGFDYKFDGFVPPPVVAKY